MIVTAVKKAKRHLSEVFFDNGQSVLLDNDTVLLCSVKSGMAVDSDKLRELVEGSDYARARSRAVWYLDRADHTEKALYDKLIKAGLNPKACAAAVARLKEVGAVDDRRFAFNLAERLLSANVSSREAYTKLLIKGVPRELAREALDSFETDERAQIRALIDKKYTSKLADKNNTDKVYAALIRKGFSYGAVRDVLKSYCEELEYISEEY